MWVGSLMGFPDEYMQALAEAVTEFHMKEQPAARTKRS
jgi:hypothetical protein